MTHPPYLQPEPDGGCRLRLRVQPKASRSGWAGTHGDALKIRIAAPPVDGKANRVLVAFLAKALGLPRTGIEIVSGLTGRNKIVRFPDTSAADLLARLPPAPAG